MKRLIVLLCAGIMTCSLSMTALANPSQTTSNITGNAAGSENPTTSTVTNNATGSSSQTSSTVTNNATGNSSQTSSTVTNNATGSSQTNSHSTVDNVKIWNKVIVDGVERDNAVSVSALTSANVIADANAQAAAIGGTVLYMVDVNCSTSFSKITIPFNVTNVAAGQNIQVLHLKSDGVWEQITPDKVENGLVTVTFNSLSPVVFVSLDSSKVRAPKTGETNAVPFAAASVVIASVGAAIASKKFFK